MYRISSELVSSLIINGKIYYFDKEPLITEDEQVIKELRTDNRFTIEELKQSKTKR